MGVCNLTSMQHLVLDVGPGSDQSAHGPNVTTLRRDVNGDVPRDNFLLSRKASAGGREGANHQGQPSRARACAVAIWATRTLELGAPAVYLAPRDTADSSRARGQSTCCPGRDVAVPWRVWHKRGRWARDASVGDRSSMIKVGDRSVASAELDIARGIDRGNGAGACAGCQHCQGFRGDSAGRGSEEKPRRVRSLGMHTY